jgi:hypothetical protein
MTAFRDAVFILTLLIGAGAMSDEYQFSPKEQQAFEDIFGKQQEHDDDTTSDNSNQE